MEMKPTYSSLLRLVLFGLLGALLLVAQVAFAWLPNIELVSVLLMVYTRLYGWRTLYPLYVFVALEGLIYGFGIWFFNYLYVWLPLVAVAYLLRRNNSPVLWALVNGTFGLLFGALCSLLYLFMGGVPAMASYWVSGLWFDILHCVGNVVTALVLSTPLYLVLNRLNRIFAAQ